MALITCENVSIGYEGQTVVKELNFSIERGDYLCIVGAVSYTHLDVYKRQCLRFGSSRYAYGKTGQHS